LSALNPQQQAAVRHTDGPLLVLAGAGSGKTSVITHKIAWLIRACGIAPQTIAAVTFTNKAAREMRTRVGDLMSGEVAKALTISTFHSLGLTILRAHLKEIGRRPGFSIYDAEDSENLLGKLLRAGSSKRVDTAAAARWQISLWKNALVAPESLAAHAAQTISGSKDVRSTGQVRELAARVYAEYEQHLAAYNALDFDDLIAKPVQLLRAHPAILRSWREHIQYLLVDEYQDTNACQYELVKLLIGERGALTVVGDDDQSIYAWRGAQPGNLRTLAEDFPKLRVVKLEQNYRSTGRILRAANSLIAHNPHAFEKKLWSAHGLGVPIRVLTARNEEHEAERVVAELQFHKFKHDTAFRDYAILYRENHQSRVLERMLREQRIPYFLSGGTSFFERTEIKDLMAYLKLITNPDDDTAFLRVINTPRREIGPATLEALAQHAGQLGTGLYGAARDAGLSARLNARQRAVLGVFVDWLTETMIHAEREEPAAVLRALLAELRYDEWLKDTCNDKKVAERRMENVMELVAWIKRLARSEDGRTLAEVVAKLSLLGMLEKQSEDNNGDYVSLMTLHAAKGLEFPHVFVVGVEEGILPHRNYLGEHGDASGPDGAAVEEERRLAYVGITRARETLTLSCADTRRRGGEVVTCEPSRFLKELPAEDVFWEGRDMPQDPQTAQERADAHLGQLRALLGSG
jgi:ATP-dependent DNA helicase Rep